MVNSKLSLLDKLNLFIGIYGRLFAAIFRFVWWSPFFIYALFQAAGFVILLWYYAPILSATVYPVLTIFFPSSIFHYPQYYLALPSIYATFESFILGITVWIIFTAVGVYRLGDVYSRNYHTIGDGVRKALHSYLPLFVVWLLEMIFVIAILYIPNLFLKDQIAGSPNMTAAVNVFFEMIGLLVTSMLIYSIPGIILDGKKLGRAIGDSIGLFFRNIFLTYAIVFLPSVIRIVLNLLLTSYAPKIISMLNPGLIPTIMVAYIIAGIFINLFIYGGAVFAYKRIAE